MDMNESLLRAVFATVARSAFSPKDVHRLVAPQVGSDKNLVAYNLCNGSTPQADIARKSKLDKGNLSRLITRWIEAGIVVRIGTDQLPLHVFPLTKDNLRMARE